MDSEAWKVELAEALTDGPGALSLSTVATGANAEAVQRIIDAARWTVEQAGWPIYELSAPNVASDPSTLPDDGYIILRDVHTPLPDAVPVLIAGYQHFVRRGLRVGLLVVGSPPGIKALRRHPGLGFLRDCADRRSSPLVLLDRAVIPPESRP